jgi:hypothetical protein
MQMFTTQLPDAKLLVLAKIALGPGGVIGVWGNALEAAGIDREAVAWLGENGYVESERRPAAGGHMLYWKITDKGARDLRLRFVG